jgi:chromosome segregation ATPase
LREAERTFGYPQKLSAIIEKIEVGMPGFENTEFEPSEERINPEADPKTGGAPEESNRTNPVADIDNSASGQAVDAEKVSSQMERFSNLSSDMVVLMSEISRETKSAMAQLSAVRLELDRKKKELETLHEMERSAEELRRVIEDRRSQLADLQQLVENQRSSFEIERSNREQESKKYLEDLKKRRQREEAEFRERQSAEELSAKQALEEELRALRQENTEKQEALARDLLEREQQIVQKEKEMDLLTQELEQFMSRLAGRTQLKPTGQDDFSDSSASVNQDG